jgi:hypothetical protein
VANLVLNGPDDEETREYQLPALTPAKRPTPASTAVDRPTPPPAAAATVRQPPAAGQLPRWVSQQPIQAWPPVASRGPMPTPQSATSQAPPAGQTAPTAPAAAGWPAQPGWRESARAAGGGATEYPTSSMVVLAAIVLLTFGALMLLVGALGFLDEDLLRDMLAEAQADISLPLAASALRITLGIVGVLGTLQLLTAVSVLAHRQWARYIGIALAALGTLVTVPALVDALRSAAQTTDLLIALAICGGYAFALFALVAGGRHFQRSRQ